MRSLIPSSAPVSSIKTSSVATALPRFSLNDADDPSMDGGRLGALDESGALDKAAAELDESAVDSCWISKAPGSGSFSNKRVARGASAVMTAALPGTGRSINAGRASGGSAPAPAAGNALLHPAPEATETVAHGVGGSASSRGGALSPARGAPSRHAPNRCGATSSSSDAAAAAAMSISCAVGVRVDKREATGLTNGRLVANEARTSRR